VDVGKNIKRILSEQAEMLRKNQVNVQELYNLGTIMLAMAYITGENYYYVLSNAFYTFSDTLTPFLKLVSMPLSIEFRQQTERLLDELKRKVPRILDTISEAIGTDKCKAMEAAAELLMISDRLNNVTENLKNLVVISTQE